MTASISPPGRATEKDARAFTETVALWKSVPKRSRTPLGQRLAEIRERIKASGQPLLSSWEELDRELADRRGEPLDEVR
jgi:hypothetical protein